MIFTLATADRLAQNTKLEIHSKAKLEKLIA